MKKNARFVTLFLITAIATVVLFMALRGAQSIPVPIVQSPTNLLISSQAAGWLENFTVALETDPFGNPSSEEIVKGLFEEWLDQFLAEGVPDDYRLENYQIDKITIYSTDMFDLAKANDMDFVAYIVYSVKPQVNNCARWWAGDGMPGEDGWINQKVEWVVVKRDQNIYTLKVLGPCPMC